MLRRLIFVLLTVMPIMCAAQLPRPVPKDRGALSTGDWFPHVFSKLAPLEEWDVILSADDIRRDRYPSDTSFQQEKNDTSVIPRFCFNFFRIRPEEYMRFMLAVQNYQGPVVWQLYGNCVGAFSQKLTSYPPLLGGTPEEFAKRMQEAIQNPPKPNPEFVKKAVADIPRFCQYLESQLAVTEKESTDFDKSWLTREGLQASRGVFDDFVERADRMPTLARTSDRALVGTQSDKMHLSFGVSVEEMSVLLTELGAKYDRDDPNDPVATDYPLLSRLSDVTMSAVYRPSETNSFLAEIGRAKAIAKQPSSVRALDKLYRIAKWAERYEDSIYFVGQ